MIRAIRGMEQIVHQKLRHCNKEYGECPYLSCASARDRLLLAARDRLYKHFSQSRRVTLRDSDTKKQGFDLPKKGLSLCLTPKRFAFRLSLRISAPLRETAFDFNSKSKIQYLPLNHAAVSKSPSSIVNGGTHPNSRRIFELSTVNDLMIYICTNENTLP